MHRNQRNPARMEGSTTDPASHAKIGLKPPADPSLPTLFLIGDSTVRNGHADGAGGQWGWGEPLVELFDTTKINVDNRAIGGRSSRSYIMENQWAETLALVKRGDVILFQWGHNDDGPLDDTARARGTIHGTGNESKEIENPILKISRDRPHLRLVSAQIRHRNAGQGCHPHQLLAHPAQDVERRQGRPQRRQLRWMGPSSRGGAARRLHRPYRDHRPPIRRAWRGRR